MSSRRLYPSAIVALVSLGAAAAPAQDAAPGASASMLSTGFKFTEASGEALYVNVCQACHMPDGRGATGAGAYPPLAGDTALAPGRRPLYVVVNGQRAMPPLGDMLNDEQAAAVVNYVRTHFGNAYQDAVTAEDAKAVRAAK